MNISVKQIRRFFAVISFMTIIFTYHVSCAWNGAFPDHTVKELKVVEVNVDAETVILESPDGKTALLTVGDEIGQEDFTIIAIHKSNITLEGPPDDSGGKRKECIPVIPIVVEDDLNFIPSVPHATDEQPAFR